MVALSSFRAAVGRPLVSFSFRSKASYPASVSNKCDFLISRQSRIGKVVLSNGSAHLGSLSEWQIQHFILSAREECNEWYYLCEMESVYLTERY